MATGILNCLRTLWTPCILISYLKYLYRKFNNLFGKSTLKSILKIKNELTDGKRSNLSLKSLKFAHIKQKRTEERKYEDKTIKVAILTIFLFHCNATFGSFHYFSLVFFVIHIHFIYFSIVFSL